MADEQTEGEQFAAAFSRFGWDTAGQSDAHLGKMVQLNGLWGDVPDEDLVIVDSITPPTYQTIRRFALKLDTRESIAEKHNFQCLYCGAKWCEIDHIHPRSRGGTNDPGNLAPACWSCNSNKRGKLLCHWLSKRADLDIEAIRRRWVAARGTTPLPGVFP